MTAIRRQIGQAEILIRADLLDVVQPAWLFPTYWLAAGRARPTPGGRGAAWFIDTDWGSWVLREGVRGGLIGRLVQRSYVWRGFEQSRPVREFAVLARLRERGLPVPEPVLAGVRRHGPIYQGVLITACIEGTQSLAALGATGARPPWSRIGAVLRALVDAGVVHPDLNAHNVLIDANQQVHVVDFDRAVVRADGRAGRDPRSRLRRSLTKLALQANASLDQAGLAELDSAYESGSK